MSPTSYKIGVLADTHDHFDPKLPEVFAGVQHILHAGDIVLPALLLDLEQIAPVTAVRGNNDFAPELRETEWVTLAGRTFLLQHIVDVRAPEPALQRRLIRHRPDVLVFGHTHRPFCETIGSTLFLNPGYAGPRRFNLPRTVAVLDCDGDGVRVTFKDL